MAIKLNRVVPKKALNAAFLKFIVKNEMGRWNFNDPSADTTSLEAEIDEMVYDVYGTDGGGEEDCGVGVKIM